MAGLRYHFGCAAEGVLHASNKVVRMTWLIDSRSSRKTSNKQTLSSTRSSTGFVLTNRRQGHGARAYHVTAIQEKDRQKHFINLIPSENFTSQAVLDALGSVMQSKFNATVTSSQAHNIRRQVLGRISRRAILRRKRAHRRG